MGLDKIRIYLKGYDYKIVDEAAKKILDTAIKSGAKVAGPIPLPTKIKKQTVIRSPHVNKKSREQFEMRTFKRMIEIKDSNQKTISQLSSINLPSGVGIEMKQL